ncbi:MAG: molybdopterin-dependent oxidoreductase [Gemmataceae bacterium]
MPTVYVSHTPNPNGKQPANLITAQVGKDAVPLVPVEIGSERLNCIQAAGKAGVFIPHYCWHPALSVVASCRMCLVEVGERKPDGSVVVTPKLVPGCQTPVKDGTVVITNSARVKGGQEQTLEGLLLNHPLDCPVCDKAGECLLQDYTYGYGRADTRMIDQKNTPPNKPSIGPNVSLFTDRCIMCSRCVRFTREVSGTAELHVTHRGNHSEIDVFPGEPLDNKLATNVVDLCPVGALCSNDFLYKHRVWNLKTQDSVCPDCSTGCSIHVDGNKNIVYRLRPRENPKSQGYFMCDDGRLGYHYVNSKERYLRPLKREGGTLKPIAYAEAIRSVQSAIKEAVAKDAFGVVAVLSPFLTCEEAYLLAKYVKGLSKATQLALGPVPVVGEDDTYPKDRRGKPVQPVKFTIRAEKCPNRRGVEKVLEHFQGKVIGFDEVVKQAGDGKLQLVYLAASYPPRGDGWITAAQAVTLKKVDTVILQDLRPSAASEVATIVLPGGAFAEKDGTFVNHAGLAQAIKWAVTPTGECRTDGQVFLDLTGRSGLLHAATLRKELAAEVKAFSALAGGELGEYGILLNSAK